MSSSILKIASIGLGVSGVVGGASTGIYLLSKKETTPDSNKQDKKQPIATKSKITDLLSKNGLVLIDESKDPAEWTKVLGTFKKDHTSKNPDGIWKIDEWNSKKDQEKGLPDLKRLCKQNGAGEVDGEDSNTYKEVVKYCTKTASSGLG